MKLNPFHLAIPVRDIAEAREFYGNQLGFEEGRSDDAWRFSCSSKNGALLTRRIGTVGQGFSRGVPGGASMDSPTNAQGSLMYRPHPRSALLIVILPLFALPLFAADGRRVELYPVQYRIAAELIPLWLEV